jgi:hypothetical protein
MNLRHSLLKESHPLELLTLLAAGLRLSLIVILLSKTEDALECPAKGTTMSISLA